MIKTTSELEQLCDEARSNKRLGLDTEFLWEKTYSPLLCLAQLNVAERIYLADPLEGIDLTPIAQLISDPEVEVVMHAPYADLAAFTLRFDANPVNTFDTQIAAGFAGFSSGLAYERLVHDVTKKRVQPSESFTDWSRRPLGEKQLRYAGEDVEHLFALRDKLGNKLSSLNRSEWVKEELSRRLDGANRYVTNPEDAWRKVGRRGKLGAEGLTVLKEVAAWRERFARTRDLPSGWVLKDPTLIELSRRKPASHHELMRVRGIDTSMKDKEVSGLLEAVERGVNSEPILEPITPHPHGIRKRTAIAKGLTTALLRSLCENENIASELVGTSSDVEHLISWVSANQPEDEELPLLQKGWRKPFGDKLIDLIEGRVQLQLTDTEPYLKVIQQHKLSDGS